MRHYRRRHLTRCTPDQERRKAWRRPAPASAQRRILASGAARSILAACSSLISGATGSRFIAAAEHAFFA